MPLSGKKDMNILELVGQEKDHLGFRIFFKSWGLNLGLHTYKAGTPPLSYIPSLEINLRCLNVFILLNWVDENRGQGEG